MQTFEINTRVDELHNQGIDLGKAGQLDRAVLAFLEAYKVIGELPMSMDTTVQSAALERDFGVLEVIFAVATDESAEQDDHIEKAIRKIGHARTVVSMQKDSVLVNIENSASQVEQFRYQISPEKYKQLYSEAYIPLSLLGRLSTVSRFVLDKPQPDLEGNYHEAHSGLIQGNNDHFTVSNALSAARHEKLAGNTAEARKWEMVAIGRTVRTLVGD